MQNPIDIGRYITSSKLLRFARLFIPLIKVATTCIAWTSPRFDRYSNASSEAHTYVYSTRLSYNLSYQLPCGWASYSSRSMHSGLTNISYFPRSEYTAIHEYNSYVCELLLGWLQCHPHQCMAGETNTAWTALPSLARRKNT